MKEQLTFPFPAHACVDFPSESDQLTDVVYKTRDA